jgi:putative membrane protein insertion efficiency factor
MSQKRDNQDSPPQGEKSPGVRASLFALSVYKAYLSALFAGTCRYEPTCSCYAYQAIERFGVLRGGWLGLRRLMRCHPLSRTFGYDPVPEKWEHMRATSELMGKTREARP